MTRTGKKSFAGAAAVRGAALSAGLVLMSSVGIAVVQADHGGFHGTPLARGPFQDRIDVKMQAYVDGKVETVQVHGAQEMVVAKITIDPGAAIGWHSHPGPAVVVVAEGTLAIFEGAAAEGSPCTDFRSYGPNQSFVDLGQGHVHNAQNRGATPVLVYVTYFDVPAGANPLQLEPDQAAYCSLPALP